MIAIVDCGIGNVGSVQNMFSKIGVRSVISRDPGAIAAAERLVLPGVGAFDSGMVRIRQSGLVPVLERRVLSDAAPVLGICLGLQLFTRQSAEGSQLGLGWLPARTVGFRFDRPECARLKVPHMGWNRVRRVAPDGWASLSNDSRFYFVHSFHVECDDPSEVLATAHYGYDFPVAVRHGNIWGVQFHPEKSHRFGMALLRDFAHA